MSLTHWLATRLGLSTHRRRGARCLPDRRSVRPWLERLEDRITPTTTINVGATTANLITAIDTADHTAGRSSWCSRRTRPTR